MQILRSSHPNILLFFLNCCILLTSLPPSRVCAHSPKSTKMPFISKTPLPRSKKEGLAPTIPPDDVCFAPEEACDLKLLQLIQTAQSEIDIAIFDINLDQLVHALIVQSKKITIRMIVDRREAKGKYSLIPVLARAGVQIKYGRQRGLMHHKFLIVDRKVVQTGSFNYTNGAAFKNHENQVYLKTPALVERYQKHFETLWNSGKLYSNQFSSLQKEDLEIDIQCSLMRS